MSKILDNEFIEGLLNAGWDWDREKLSPEDAEKMQKHTEDYNRISGRINELGKRLDSLTDAELAEYNDSVAAIKEFHHLEARRQTTEELQNFLDDMAARNYERTPFVSVVIEAYEEALAQRKTEGK